MKMIYYVITLIFLIAVIVLSLKGLTAKADETPIPSKMDIPRLCESIKDVENTPYSHIGDAGERSSWQVTSDVWQAHSNKPFWWASVEAYPELSETKRVVVLHVLWIRRRLGHLGLEDTPHDIALVYKAGYGRVMARKTRPQDRDYAKRVSNVYYDSP